MAIVKPTGFLSTASTIPPNTRRYPLSYVYAGRYTWSSGVVGYQNQNADWWTATTKDSEFVYRLFIGDGANNPQDSNYKDRGFSLRSNTARRYPLSYVFSGYYLWGGGNLSSQDSYGRWWSTAAYSDNNAYYLTMNSSDLVPQNNANKARGFTLRCVSYYSTGARRYPLSYVLSGDYVWGDGNLYSQDSRGYWWSTTASSDSDAYDLYMNSSNLNPQNNNTKAGGFSLRCASREKTQHFCGNNVEE